MVTVTVPVVQVTPMRHKSFEEFTGTVQARVRGRVESKITGRISNLPVGLGWSVKKGDLIAELDAKEYQAKLEQARAAFSHAERELERFTLLLRHNAVTRQEFESFESQSRIAKAVLSEAETMLHYTRIVAPFDGVVAHKLAEPGDLAQPGRPLVEIESAGPMVFESGISESLIHGIKLGDGLPVRIASLPDERTGTVVEISPAAREANRTFLIKLELPESANLRSGQFGRVAIPVGESDLLAVPRGAVVERGQLQYVIVVQDGAARWRLVRTGKILDGHVQVLSGLDLGEWLVVDEPSKLADGQPVVMKP